MDVRVLTDAVTGRPAGTEVSAEDLAALYAPERLPWLAVNMIASVDGSATGADGRSGGINNPSDKQVFDTLRRSADAVLVGAGTADEEGYRPAGVPIVLVSRRGRVPERLRAAGPGRVLLVTTGAAEGLSEARSVLGEEQVLLAGRDTVDLPAMLAALHERGLRHLLGEGGPSLLGDLLAAGVVDELCVSTAPLVVGGDHPRIVAGPDVEARLALRLLLEEQGTLLARWRVLR